MGFWSDLFAPDRDRGRHAAPKPGRHRATPPQPGRHRAGGPAEPKPGKHRHGEARANISARGFGQGRSFATRMSSAPQGLWFKR